MPQLKRALAEIQKYLGEMTLSQKMLIAALAALAVGAVIISGSFSGGPGMVPLSGFEPEQQDLAYDVLVANGFDVRRQGGELVVPAGEGRAAIARLAQSGALPDDTTQLFSTYGEQIDWRDPKSVHDRKFIFALQNELARVLAGFDTLRSATVIIDDPQPRGLGAAVEESTASVTLWPAAGSLTQDTVDAAADVVAGAVAGLKPSNVRIIDGSSGMPRAITDESRRLSGAFLEHARAVEEEMTRKLERVVGHIPGVVVAVSAQVDIRTVSEEQRRYLPRGEGTESLILSENTTEKEQSTPTPAAAEPGIRSNQGADINEAQGSADTLFTEATGDATFENAIGQRVTQVVDPRGVPTRIAASVNVPEPYIRTLLELEASTDPEADADAGPPRITPQEVRARFEQVRTDIERIVQPHLKIVVPGTDPGSMQELTGEVAVALMPAAPPPLAPQQAGGLFGMLTAGGDTAGTVELIETVTVGALALIALGMMLMMVRRAGKRIDLPSAEELVGVPPQLGQNQDLVGEAEESEAAMDGIEVDEDEIAYQRMLEQISSMVENDPEKSAQLLHQWSDEQDDF